jgi:hypothetical protein
MGETPSKPSPEPVLKVMQALNVKSAVLIGDTPDDMRAAVSAGSFILQTQSNLMACSFYEIGLVGILGLGVVAPSVLDKVKDAKNLADCGAMHVLLPGLHQLAYLA